MTEPGQTALPGDTSQPVSVVHAPERSRYELRHDGTTIGFSTYGIRPTEQVVFTHTVVDDAYAGQGLALELTHFALDDVRASGRRIVSICPYVTAYLRKHPEYDDIVDYPPRRGQVTHPEGTS